MNLNLSPIRLLTAIQLAAMLVVVIAATANVSAPSKDTAQVALLGGVIAFSVEILGMLFDEEGDGDRDGGSHA